MPSDEEDAHVLAKAKKDAQNEAYQSYQQSVEKAKNLWMIIWFLLVATATGATWTTNMQLTVNGLQKEVDGIQKVIDERGTRIGALEQKVSTYVESNNLAMVTMNNSITTLSDSVKDNKDSLREMKPHVDKMWWMKEQRITNDKLKDDTLNDQ